MTNGPCFNLTDDELLEMQRGGYISEQSARDYKIKRDYFQFVNEGRSTKGSARLVSKKYGVSEIIVHTLTRLRKTKTIKEGQQ